MSAFTLLCDDIVQNNILYDLYQTNIHIIFSREHVLYDIHLILFSADVEFAQLSFTRGFETLS